MKVFSLAAMLRDKRLTRDRLAREPIANKLRILDELRAREVSIRSASKGGKKIGGKRGTPLRGN